MTRAENGGRRAADGTTTVGIVANEFFDASWGRMGGFGWVARHAALSLTAGDGSGTTPPVPPSPATRPMRPVFLTGELTGPGGAGGAESAGVPVLFRTRWRSEYVRLVRSYGIDLFLTVDYRPNYNYPLTAAPDAPFIVWVNDPRPPEDVEKVNSLRIPGATSVQPQGIEPIDCRPLARLADEARDAGRPVLFASPAPGLVEKVPGTFGLEVPGLDFLPYSLDIDAGRVVKSDRPRVVFLGRLDPIKRPWVFLEIARRVPGVEFLFLGRSHFRGGGAWEARDVPDNVRFLGHVEGEEKHRILQAAWVLVNTSIHEALPVSFVESLAYEVPIVSCQNPEGLASRFGTYVGRWDGTGLEGLPLFVEGVRRLVEDPELRAGLGREGRRWATEHHSRSRFLTAMSDLCRRAVGGESAPFAVPDSPRDEADAVWRARVRESVRQISTAVPGGDTLILVNEGQWEPYEFGADLNSVPFLERGGAYWGAPPDDETAVRELERMRGEGARHIAFVWTTMWWLEHYRGMARHLHNRYRRTLRTDDAIVFELRPAGP